jgi:gliding motility-associated-like protein
MKKIKHIAMCLMLAQMSFAQPANNDCTGAITLTPSPVCNPVTGNTAGATQSLVGCTGTANDDVWYTFTATQTGHAVNVSGNGTFNPVLQVYSASCGGTSLACLNQTAAGGTESYQATNFVIGNQYWIRVYDFAAGFPSNTTFIICVSNPIVEPPCDPNSPEPANTMNPCPQVPKICRVNGFCGTTQGYHATPTATTLTPYTANFWAQLNTAFCGSIENNSFMQFTASAASVQLRVYGSCTSGTGIQMMAFSLDSGLCNSGTVTSYGCYGNMNLNTAPASGIPLTFSGMVPGQTYYLMVDGFAGAICNYKIGAVYGVQVSAYVSPNISNICLGTAVQLQAGGGDGTYSWNPEPTLSATTGSIVTATPTALGTYTYVVNSLSTDTTCPANSDTATINVYTSPVPNAGVDDTVCFNGASTLINLSGSISNPANTALWQLIPPVGPPVAYIFAPSSGTPVTAVVVNQPGLYKLVLNETNIICGAYKDTVEILVLSHQQTVANTAPTCYGGADGTITITNPNAVEYSFDNGVTWVTNSTQGGFTAGTYTVRSKNYYGCVISSATVITNPPAVTISTSNDTLICENGTATMSALGGNGTGFNYNWSHTSDLSSTQSVSPVTAGYYYVSATSALGCITPTDSIFVDINPPLQGSISAGVTICPGDQTMLTSNAMDGNGGPYTHTWNSGGVGNGVTHTINVSPASTSTYTVTISDACETTPVTYSTIVTVAPVPQPTFDVLVDSMCSPGSYTIFNTTDPVMVQSASWFISDGATFNSIDTITTGDMYAGSYAVSLTIISPNGCVNTATTNNFIVAMPIPVSKFRFSPEVVTAFSTKVSFDNLSTGNFNNYWTFPLANPGTSTAVNPNVTFPEAVVDNYMVELIVESQFGCLDTSYQLVEVRPEVLLFAPNTFTPDGDEHNATWRVFIEGIEAAEFELTVYNRWGEMIWQSFDPEGTWDGFYKGKLVPTGTYNWKLRANDAMNGEMYQWTGHINLLK